MSATTLDSDNTRDILVTLLKRQGPQDVRRLAANLSVSDMAVRQHLRALQVDGLVDFDTVPRPMGRPAKLWRLTDKAQARFPDGHQDLALDLLASMREAFGEKGLESLLEVRSERQSAAYRMRMAKARGLKARLDALAEIRTEEGYMASVTEMPSGDFLFVENHCPVCAAAAACQGLCRHELQVFQECLGKDVLIDRTEHIVKGARRCAYRVAKAASPKGDA